MYFLQKWIPKTKMYVCNLLWLKCRSSWDTLAEPNVFTRAQIGHLLRRARKPRHASVFSTHSDTQAVPAFHCIRKLEKAVAVRNSLLERFSGKFRHCWKILPRFPAARNAIPAKVWALSGKENGCWKIDRAFGNAAGFFPLRPPQPSWVLLNVYECLKAFFRHASVFKTHRHAVYQCFKEVSDISSTR